MEYNDYLNTITHRFSQIEKIQLRTFDVCMMYEEKFEVKWVATKLKNFSFISSIYKIGLDDIVSYSSVCMDYALKRYKGLPRGFQNGVTSFNVLVSENVSEEAIEFATARPKKHFAAFEMPVILDLSSNNIYYYKDTPIWGAIYYRYFREYIEAHFNTLFISQT